MTQSRPNVLLLILDSVRAANTSLCGYERDTTPFLDELASNATVFEEARVGGQWSLTSHANIFTGLHTEEHELYDTDRRIESGRTIFSELAEQGYSTGVFSSNDYITGDVPTGLETDFDISQGRLDPPFPDATDPMEYDDPKQFLRDSLRNAPIRSALNGVLVKLGWDMPWLIPDRLLRYTSCGYPHDSVYADLFSSWMKGQEGPWAACLNFMGPHQPYRATSDDPWYSEEAAKVQNQFESLWEFYCGRRPWSELSQTVDLYDCVIRTADELVREVVNELKRTGEYENTLLVVTGDHGEGFGERSQILPDVRIAGHKIGVHEALLHVPLVVKYPHQTTGIRTNRLASLTNFPNAVRAATDGSAEPGREFAVDRFALASAHGVNRIASNSLKQYCTDEREQAFDQRIRVAYEQRDGSIVKEMSTEDRSVRLDLRDGEPFESDGSLVEAAFKDVRPAGVITRQDETIDEVTKSHLEDLGYV